MTSRLTRSRYVGHTLPRLAGLAEGPSLDGPSASPLMPPKRHQLSVADSGRDYSTRLHLTKVSGDVVTVLRTQLFSSVTIPVLEVSMGMPGPMVLLKLMLRRYLPLAADGLARTSSPSSSA